MAFGTTLLYSPLAILIAFSRSCWALFTSLNVERCQDLTGRVHVLQLHLIHANAEMVAQRQHGQAETGELVKLTPPRGSKC